MNGGIVEVQDLSNLSPFLTATIQDSNDSNIKIEIKFSLPTKNSKLYGPFIGELVTVIVKELQAAGDKRSYEEILREITLGIIENMKNRGKTLKEKEVV